MGDNGSASGTGLSGVRGGMGAAELAFEPLPPYRRCSSSRSPKLVMSFGEARSMRSTDGLTGLSNPNPNPGVLCGLGRLGIVLPPVLTLRNSIIVTWPSPFGSHTL